MEPKKKFVATVIVEQYYERVIYAHTQEEAEEKATKLDFIDDKYYVSSDALDVIVEEDN